MIEKEQFIMVKRRLEDKGLSFAAIGRMAGVSKVYARRAARGEFPTPGGNKIRDMIVKVIDDPEFNPYQGGE